VGIFSYFGSSLDTIRWRERICTFLKVCFGVVKSVKKGRIRKKCSLFASACVMCLSACVCVYVFQKQATLCFRIANLCVCVCVNYEEE
jgi:hypothetical protein